MAPSTDASDGLRARGSARRPNIRPGDDDELSIQEAQAALLREYGLLDLTASFPQRAQGQEGRGRYRYSLKERNASLESSHRPVSVWKFGNVDLKPGTCVELRKLSEEWKIQFVEIKSIWVSGSDGSVIIRGLPYARTRSLGGKVEMKRNEVCQILEPDDDDNRSDESRRLFETNPQQILRVRTLYKTNALFPAYQYGGQDWSHKTDLEREEQAPLTCRWKLRVDYEDSFPRKTGKRYGDLIGIRQAEASPQFRRSDKEIRVEWRRGTTTRGGSHVPGPGAGKQQYTFADICCGAGGTSHGAVMAGLKLRFGVDHWPQACASWRRNFSDARMYEQDLTYFIQHTKIDGPIDCLHLSPPCQPWCRYAYIHGEREDDPNKDLLLSCSDIIDKCRNRIFTLEQTFSILDPAHEDYFSALVQGFTRHGFSVRWRVIPLIQYGLPQDRKRLLMIGACPGEQLPPWPPATHSATPGQGLKPFVTEAEALRGLNSRRVSLHDVARAKVRHGPARNSNLPFPKTITCGGTQGIQHSSGTRDFTVREIACLQGFPTSHEFEGNRTAIKKQIGNAFPSCVVKNIYGHLRRWLEDVDGVQRAPAQARPPALQVARPPSAVDRRHRGIPRPTLPVEPRHHVNGDLDEDEALQLALQESMRGPQPSASAASAALAASAAVVEISDDEDQQQDSPVSAVAPPLERMSIAPSDHWIESDQRIESDPEGRSRSVTLDFSPSPSPGPSSRATKAASYKRSIDIMHDGEDDEVMKEESPPKREKSRDHEKGIVGDGKIPSSLPQYTGPKNASNANDENVAIGQAGRRQNGSRNTNVDGSTPEGRDASAGDIVLGESAIDWLSVFPEARMAGNSGDEVWTF